MILDTLSEKDKHPLNQVSEEALTALIKKMLANYMTPSSLVSSDENIQSLAHELMHFSI